MSLKRKNPTIDDETNTTPPRKRQKLNTNTNTNDMDEQQILCNDCNIMVSCNEYLSHLTGHAKNNYKPKTIVPCEYTDHLRKFQNTQLPIQNPFEITQNDISYNNSFEDNAFWLTKSPFIHNTQFTLSINDIINCSSNSNSVISKCIIFCHMININWLIHACPILKNKTKVENICIFHGSHMNKNELNEINKLSLNIIIKKIKIPNKPFGSHNTKMFLIEYKNEGIRIVITTADINPMDWLMKTNGIYLQDFPLKYDNIKNNKCEFLKILQTYCNDLNFHSDSNNNNNKIMDFSFINKYDFSSAKCLLIPSIPGYHTNKHVNYYGHMRLKYLLKQYNIPNEQHNCLISCTSEIGLFDEKWITDQLFSQEMKTKKFKLIWPTVNDIKNSIEGYNAGIPLFFLNDNYLKMQWLKDKYFYQWNGSISNRKKLMPQINCFCNINKENKSLNYFVLTSNNLSKESWGDLEYNNSQPKLFIQSYEMGCLFIKEYYINNYLKHKHKEFCLNDLPFMKRNLLEIDKNKNKKQDNDNIYDNCELEMIYQTNKNKENDHKNIIFPVPMEVFEVEKYSNNNKPWISYLNYNEKDSHGLTWKSM